MPYDWRTGMQTVGPTGMSVPVDPAATAGLGHPAWLNPVYKPPPKYPIQRVGPNGMPVPTDPAATAGLGHPSFLDSLYPKKKAAAKTPAYVDPWQKIINQLQGYFETPAQQEARINREIDAQIAAQKKLLDDDYARQMANAQAMAAGQEAAGAAAAAMNKDLFGAVGGEFNAAAGEIKGLAHSLSKNAQGATAGDVSAANAGLGALGNAPVTEGGTFGVGGGKQQGVEEYRGGTLPGQMFGTQGEAANFGLAGMIASQGMKAHEEAQAALITTTREINDSQSKAIQSLAAGRADLFHTYMNDAKDSQIKYISLVQGLMADRSSAIASQSKAGMPVTKTVKGTLLQWDPTSMTWKKIFEAPATGSNKPVTRTSGGIIYQWNPKNGQWVPVAGTPTANAPTVQTFPDGKYQWDPATQSWRKIAGTTPAAKPKKGQLTDLQIKNMVTDWYAGKGAKPVPVVVGQTATGNPIYHNLPPGTKYRAPDGTVQTVPGNKVGGFVDYQTALRKLKAFGVDQDKARQILDAYYRRGSRKRPWVDVVERNVLSKAKQHPNARYLPPAALTWVANTHPDIAAQVGKAYLDQGQVDALTKANMLPQGIWVNMPFGLGRAYLLAAGLD
jgi:hypothetical protein